jgi:hypothetical protein
MMGSLLIFTQGDVLSGKSSSGGVHHHGVIEGWFGPNRWNGRFSILVIVTLGVFTPLTCFKRVGAYMVARLNHTKLQFFFSV